MTFYCPLAVCGGIIPHIHCPAQEGGLAGTPKPQSVCSLSDSDSVPRTELECFPRAEPQRSRGKAIPGGRTAEVLAGSRISGLTCLGGGYLQERDGPAPFPGGSLEASAARRLRGSCWLPRIRRAPFWCGRVRALEVSLCLLKPLLAGRSGAGSRGMSGHGIGGI